MTYLSVFFSVTLRKLFEKGKDIVSNYGGYLTFALSGNILFIIKINNE